MARGPKSLKFYRPVMSSAEDIVKVSMIVTAYNRKDYLLSAVSSVAGQTLGKDLYEVVVVKNFEDKRIDDYIRGLGFKNVVYDTRGTASR